MKVIGLIPFKNEEYLEFRYGKNWRTPIKNWIPSRDDKNKIDFIKNFKKITSS